MNVIAVQTHAGRGGPEATSTLKSIYPTGRVMLLTDPIQNSPTTMPPCPYCGGSGEKLELAQMTCPLCEGRKNIPRFLYDRIVLDLAVLSLELE